MDKQQGYGEKSFNDYFFGVGIITSLVDVYYEFSGCFITSLVDVYYGFSGCFITITSVLLRV